MGGLLHLFDFHSNDFAKKVFPRKNRDEDLEAPRNSLELQVENFPAYSDMKDTKMSYGFEEEWHERNCYPIEASLKKHIAEELSKRCSSNDKQNTPSIVAKLMGVDALPERARRSRKGWTSVTAFEGNGTESSNLERYERPKRREHPQEEELQRFKREFEAWQAMRFKECSRIIDPGNHGNLPLIQTEHKVSEGMTGRSGLTDGFRCDSGLVVHDQKDKLFTRTRSFGREFNLKSDRAPTKIVVLKPGPHRFYDYEDSLTTSSGTMDGSRGSIEDFLEEVKDRLKSELLHGRTLKRSSTVRGSGIETPFSERPLHEDDVDDENNTKKTVCIGRNNHLPRSESTRSYAGEVQFNASDSPEFVSRDTRRLLAERLRPTVSDMERRLKEIREISKSDEQEDTRNRSLGRGNGYNDVRDQVSGKKDSSPRNLIRSLSAPVSGTSFGKLLLEDRNVLTGAQIRRKHESAEQEPSIDPIRRRKERFNLRKKVSSIRSTLRGKIFGKKIRSMIESNSFEDEYIKDFVTGSRFTSFYDRNENSTEVPPSPASACSNTPDEFWRNVDYLSPVSTPDVSIADENGFPRVFRDISSNLSELRRQINELESDLREDTLVEQEANHEPESINIANPDKAFVRDLLVASGLYDGTSDRSSLSRWDPFAKPIQKSVFQETEENHRKTTKLNTENEATGTKAETDHNLLFDLLNETLAIVLGPPVSRSSFRRKLVSSSGLAPPRGKYLVEAAWQVMSEYLNAQTEKPWCSLDGIIAWDLGSSPWSGLMDEEVNVLGREIEGLIMADLVEDLVKDMQAQTVFLRHVREIIVSKD
ncbi:PREDICTED: uncharacterized protein LOC104804295 [Tarenaya hassleriana]|uniref:uncharacterized protein LOC104804295 n=1 Tax=Tarenaya hassleriana TaxID=28532 RepID=UPI00053C74AE|nr:PREDICTED: uncharacterized protein LOC104804295 [Tarenaya hassleriana]XP_010526850.1 PREDICTED: uncharacterized protein LOC104804295 [Tarenaya hassleriana]XP_010526851.1 PREDICTED: uncharacterized protein LOC104804295 [Tarenaya hassleriana]XP_010526852.1 PREDICTED: uncharacterized protein LOC104804295 [Tarenaya hassleriana]